MAFAEDLLKQAFLLLNKEPKTPTQASLRRSVSTAYYALFHLLVQDASANWSRLDARDYLARAFEHKTMKEASTRAENATFGDWRTIRSEYVAQRYLVSLLSNYRDG